MKRIALLLIIATLSLTIAACGVNQQEDTKTIKIGATAVPHAQILEKAKPILKEQGVNIEVIVYQDYVQPNIHLSEGEVDANFFQHVPYFESFTSEKGIDNLSNVAKIHIEPMGIYSNKIDNLNKLKDGATISIPQDPTNMGRSLALLEKAGLITLKEGVGVMGTKEDIVKNPKNLKILLLDAPMLPRSLEDVDISVINTNFAIQAKLNPTKDALLLEDADSPYANVLTVRTEDKDNESLKKLIEILNSNEIKGFIEDKYEGAIVPAF